MSDTGLEPLLRWGVLFFWGCVPIAQGIAARDVLRGGDAPFPVVLAALRRAGVVTALLSIPAAGAWWGLEGRASGAVGLQGLGLFPAFALLSVGVASATLRVALETAGRAEVASARARAAGVVLFFLAASGLYGVTFRSLHAGSLAENLLAVAALGVALTALGLNRLGGGASEGLRRLAGDVEGRGSE